MKIEYLLFNVLIFFGSSIAATSFPGAERIKFKPALQAIATIAFPFIITDMLVTDWFWSFNSTYITGFKIGNLPIEEALFFFTVPWACLLIWINIQKYGQQMYDLRRWVLLVRSVIGLVALYALYNRWWYTGIIALVLLLLSGVVRWEKVFRAYVLFGVIVSLLTLIFNTYLTSRPIILYNSTTMTNVRLGTIPIEDFFYGLILVLGVVALYERGLKRLTNKSKSILTL